MGKKTKMQKEVDKAEQLDLMDVKPKNAKQIVTAARVYKQLQAARMEALQKEVAQKQAVLRYIKEAKLQPLEGGKIKFQDNGLTICVTPRDNLLTVKEESDE